MATKKQECYKGKSGEWQRFNDRCCPYGRYGRNGTDKVRLLTCTTLTNLEPDGVSPVLRNHLTSTHGRQQQNPPSALQLPTRRAHAFPSGPTPSETRWSSPYVSYRWLPEVPPRQPPSSSTTDRPAGAHRGPLQLGLVRRRRIVRARRTPRWGGQVHSKRCREAVLPWYRL